MLQIVSKEEHKDLLNRLKEEQNRKIAALADQYESTIDKMVTEQTVTFWIIILGVIKKLKVKLDSQQEEELKELTEKLVGLIIKI